MNEKMVIISAPSGAGKTTIVNYLLEKDHRLEFSVSATTRKPRGSEINGKEYFFFTAGEFRKRIKNGEFAEWEVVYSNQYYGTLKSEIERIRGKNKHVLFDVDPRGGISLKNLYGHKAISIFLMPPSVKELEKRLLIRATDDLSKVKVRVGKALEEMKLAVDFDHIVINNFLEQAQIEVFKIVQSFMDNL